MASNSPAVVVALNAGSGTVKATAFQASSDDLAELTPFWELDVVRHTDPQQIVITANGTRTLDTAPSGDVDAAVRPGLIALREAVGASSIVAVGHRIVHGGPYDAPAVVDDSVVEMIRRAGTFAPLHNQIGLDALAIARDLFDDACHVAVFDSMFHSTIPLDKTAYGGPRDWIERGLVRVGFHGISHEDAARRTAAAMDRRVEDLELITVHLGGGCSAAAVRHGRSIDTTMGLTPTAGMVMATRSGTVDPGLLVYVLRNDGLDADGLDEVLNRRSGLMGLTGGRTGDIGEVHRLSVDGDAQAALAEDLYVNAAAREIAGIRSSLDGLDALVFTGSGVEGQPWLRRRIADRLRHLGVGIDDAQNSGWSGEDVGDLSSAKSSVSTFVVAADENRVIARHALGGVLGGLLGELR